MFWTRFASSVVLAVIALLALIMGGPVMAGILLLISFVAYLELVTATGVQEKKAGWNGLTIVGLAGVLAYYAVIFFAGGKSLEMMVIIGTLLAEMFVYVIAFPKYTIEQAAMATFSLIYAPVMFSFMYQTRELPYGIYIVWLILICSWGCDTCAYLVGILIGKKKIFPVLSPKKSLEGCIGGVLGAMLLGFLYSYFLLNNVVKEQSMNLIVVIICGVGAVMSQLGDLAASAIKRNHDIKDYGKLIPGHGGIMDRFDSVLVTAPMIYFMVILLMK